MVAMVATVAACRSTNPETKPSEDVLVPKMTSDASNPNNGASSASAAASTAPAPAPSNDKNNGGWLLKDEVVNPQYAERSEVLTSLKSDPRITHRSLASFSDKLEECSSAGGAHAFFDLEPPNKGVLHYGGHGSRFMPVLPKKGALFVVGYKKLAQRESVKHDAFCVPDRMIDGRAIGMLPVASKEEGERILADLMK